jgi:hypothetical protein
MPFEIDMLACASHEDERQRYCAAIEAEETRLTRETIALAKIGEYARLLDAMDYRDNDVLVMRALVLCANKGNVEARDALDTLARTYADLNAEVA